MILTMLRHTTAPVATSLLFLAAGGLTACNPLSVSDPTAIEETSFDNAQGADLLWQDARTALYQAGHEGALASGLLGDELLSDPPSYYRLQGITSWDEVLDRRESAHYEQGMVAALGGIYATWQTVRRAASVAMPKLRAHALAPAHLGEMFAVRGFAAVRMAEDFCPGFPLNDIVDYKPVYGAPLSTDAVFEHALADFDSAAVYAADSARILDFVRVGRARALLGLARFTDAAAAAAAVSTGYVYTAPAGGLVIGQYGDLSQSVADNEGDDGLDFVSAGDPRVPTTRLGTANDGVTGIYGIAYSTATPPMAIASGIEARLIEAEAALASGGDWLGILNALRTTCTDAATCPTPAPAGSGGVAGLPPLTDPGTAETRVDLLFRERAFWLFVTGHRLGDLRRLISHYGRASETVFPTGPYWLSGAYDIATSIPFPASLETPYNAAVTGCASR